MFKKICLGQPDTMTGGWEEVEESVHPSVCHSFPHHPEGKICKNTTLCMKHVQNLYYKYHPVCKIEIQQ